MLKRAIFEKGMKERMKDITVQSGELQQVKEIMQITMAGGTAMGQ